MYFLRLNSSWGFGSYFEAGLCVFYDLILSFFGSISVFWFQLSYLAFQKLFLAFHFVRFFSVGSYTCSLWGLSRRSSIIF